MTASLLTRNPRWLAVAGSIALSLLTILTDSLINDDGLLYIAAAEWWLQGEWRIAYHHYQWPAYPLLLAGLSALTGWTPELVGRALAVAALAALSYGFVVLVEELARGHLPSREMAALPTSHTPLFAALVIVGLPFFGECRPQLLRDHLYWAFYLLALVQFHRHLHQPRWRHALGWSGAMLAATLFRVEGSVFLLLLPPLLLLRSGWNGRERLRAMLQGYALTALAGGAMLAAFLLLPALADYSGRLFEPLERAAGLLATLEDGFARYTAPLEEMLAPYSTEFALPGLLAIILMIVAQTLLKVLSPLHAALLLIRPLRANLPWTPPLRLLLWGGIAINLLILFVFTAKELFLQTRFGFPLAVLPLLLVPFLLTAAEQRWRQRQALGGSARWLFPGALAVLLLAALASLISTTPGRHYLKEAGLWVGAQLPPRSQVRTNSSAVAYYANRDLPWLERLQFLNEREPAPAPGYLALQALRGRLPAWTQGLTPLASFENRRHDGVWIYRLPDSPPPSRQEASP